MTKTLRAIPAALGLAVAVLAVAAACLLTLPRAAGAQAFEVNDRDLAAKMLAADALLAVSLLYAPPAGNVHPMLAYSPRLCSGPEGCVIDLDHGGEVLHYRMAAELLHRSTGTLRVRGDCYSACTLLVDELAAVGRACMEPTGRLHVHRGRVVFLDGSSKPSSGLGYTPALHRIVEARGGQPIEGWLTLTPDDLAGVVPACR